MKIFHTKNSGSATLEYVFITIFGLILTASAMKLIHKLYESKIAKLNSELNLDLDLGEIELEALF